MFVLAYSGRAACVRNSGREKERENEEREESKGDKNREKQYAYASLRAARHTEATGTVKLTRMLLTVAASPSLSLAPFTAATTQPSALSLSLSFSLSLSLDSRPFLSFVLPPSTLAFALLSYAFILAAVYARYNCILGMKCSSSMHLFFFFPLFFTANLSIWSRE